VCLALGTRLVSPHYLASRYNRRLPLLSLPTDLRSVVDLFSEFRCPNPGRTNGTDGLGRAGKRGIRRSSSCRKQLEGLRNLQPWREAIPGTLLQLLPSVRCKLGEWREATQSMMEATQSTVTTAAGGEEDGEEGAVGGEAVEDVEMEDTGADEASELEEAEAGAAAEEEEARNAAAGRRVFEARVMGAANGLQLLVTVRFVILHLNQPPWTHACISH
jgi:hypothetical protein